MRLDIGAESLANAELLRFIFCGAFAFFFFSFFTVISVAGPHKRATEAIKKKKVFPSISDENKLADGELCETAARNVANMFVVCIKLLESQQNCYDFLLSAMRHCCCFTRGSCLWTLV